MPHANLSAVQHLLQVGAPLPFDIRDADHQLLLARGQQVQSAAQLQQLLQRGALVELDALQSAEERARHAPREQLPGLWQDCMSHVADALRDSEQPGFRHALNGAIAPVQALIERDPDLAIFQVLRQAGGEDADYGVQRAMQTAITAHLVAHRLGWTADEAQRAFKVALTMNVSMLQLQGQLARQTTAPSDEQRQQLRTHPLRSARLLAQAGITDADWLRAVMDHHEVEDGSGYPGGKTSVSDLASLARRADVYTAKLAARSYRDAMAADMAGRQIFMQDPGHPMTAALVREFGIYPPGCHVRLASGEVGLVVQRGPTITTPVVCCLSDAHGVPLPAPVRRDTAQRAYAVQGILGGRRIPLSLEDLGQLLAA